MGEIPALPTLGVEGRSFTRLIPGHKPFLGGPYMSRAKGREYEERSRTYEPIRNVILAALGLGVRTMMLSIHLGCGRVVWGRSRLLLLGYPAIPSGVGQGAGEPGACTVGASSVVGRQCFHPSPELLTALAG